jgi:hypothetical protein
MFARTIAVRTLSSVLPYIDRCGAREPEIPDIGKAGNAEGDRALHEIRALVWIFCYDISHDVDDINVVARPTKQSIGTRATVQRVLARSTVSVFRSIVTNEDIVRVISQYRSSPQYRSA